MSFGKSVAIAQANNSCENKLRGKIFDEVKPVSQVTYTANSFAKQKTITGNTSNNKRMTTVDMKIIPRFQAQLEILESEFPPLII